MAIDNPCPGSGQEPTRRYRTSLDMGSKFGGKLMGCCPVEGCHVRVTASGRIAKHEEDAGGYARRFKDHHESAQESLARGIDPNDPRHLD